MYKLPDGIGTLIPFEVDLMRLRTLSTAFLPVPKTLLEGFFGMVFNTAVTFSISHLYSQNGIRSLAPSVSEQPEVARSHIWRVGKDWNSMFHESKV